MLAMAKTKKKKQAKKKANEMDIGKTVGGALLISVAVWAFVSLADPAAKYLGAAILGILGLALVFSGYKK